MSLSVLALDYDGTIAHRDVVSAEVRAAIAAALDLIRSLELPLVLVFNRGRVMITTQGVSKATGLQTALETLRHSPRNTVAIGDAENDHELRLAEVGVAVEWGSSVTYAATVCAIDPEGDYGSLEALPGVTVLGREDAPTHASCYARSAIPIAASSWI